MSTVVVVFVVVVVVVVGSSIANIPFDIVLQLVAIVM